MTHMSHAVQTAASRFQLALSPMFFHVSREALRGPTLARVAMFRLLYLVEGVHKNVTVGECRDQRKNAAIPFAASVAFRWSVV